ncbi:hypothetical protein EVJ58_g6132 [Rhodofomes roseus]|uniref:C2H2-type domain-containing protein n=1 Tax=Rhodofomes roseus TaxID=34475 RepID=A0A4Y9YBP3_9APHY|nr:hypothetical protein EVJ58_g6132 [Rhodofomes roseus]
MPPYIQAPHAAKATSMRLVGSGTLVQFWVPISGGSELRKSERHQASRVCDPEESSDASFAQDPRIRLDETPSQKATEASSVQHRSETGTHEVQVVNGPVPAHESTLDATALQLFAGMNEIEQSVAVLLARMLMNRSRSPAVDSAGTMVASHADASESSRALSTPLTVASSRTPSPSSDQGSVQHVRRPATPTLSQASDLPPEVADDSGERESGRTGDEEDEQPSGEGVSDNDSFIEPEDDDDDDSSYEPKPKRAKRKQNSVAGRTQSAHRKKQASKVASVPRVAAAPVTRPTRKGPRRRIPIAPLAQDKPGYKQEGRYWCRHDGCNASFVLSPDRTRHEAAHTGHPQCKCMHCGDKFSRFDAGLRHSQTAHKNKKPHIERCSDEA